MKTLTLLRPLLLAAAIVCSVQHSSVNAATNIVTNGGFETGSFSGWTQGGDLDFTDVIGSAARTGSFGASFGPPSTQLGTITQSLPTTIGATYSLSYALLSPGGIPNSFEVRWDGNVIFSLLNTTAFPYTLSTIGGLVATSSSTQLTFAFRHVPGFWNLDDVSVEESVSGGPSNGVPDGGATVGLMGFALAGLAGIRRLIRQ